MVRILLLCAACVAACNPSDDPSITVSGDTHGGVVISVSRAPGYPFPNVRATINGVDAGTPHIDPGRDATIKLVPAPATALFLVPQAQIGSSLHVVIDDDGAQYTLDAPDFGSPRTPTVVTPLDVPLHQGDWVEVTTGIASDTIGKQDDLAAWMVAKLAGPDDEDCFTQWAWDVGDGETKFQVPPDFERAWECHDTPIPTSPLAITLVFVLGISPAITTCTGPALTCSIILPLPTATFDATVQL